MDHHFILLLLTIVSGTAVCKVYYVVPSQETQCEDYPCITLTQFASIYSLYIETTNTTLVLEPGNHTLSASLIVRSISRFTIVSNSSHIPMIMCSTYARIAFTNIFVVHIRGIWFIECGFSFDNVKRLILKNDIFMGYSEHPCGTALQLNLTTATITQCSFVDLVGTIRNFSTSGVTLYVSVGGAITLFQSSLTIIRSTFRGNSATLGGALFAWIQCNITISNTTFTKNQAVCYNKLCENGNISTAPQGGVLNLQDCNLLIQHTTFDSNHASESGGVIAAIQSYIRIEVTTFKNNSVATNENSTNLGGVISTIQSTINFTNSTFSFNTANYGGVIHAHKSIITLYTNKFIDNIAKIAGGVLMSYQDCVHIIHCQFINCSANLGGSITAVSSTITTTISFFANSTSSFGGVMSVSECDISFSRNTFSHNYAKFDGVLAVLASNITMYEDIFMFNMGEVSVIIAAFSMVTICDTFIGYNRATDRPLLYMFHVTFNSCGVVNITNNNASEGVIEYVLCQADLSGRTLFYSNIGSIVIRYSKVTFNGFTYISDCSVINASRPSVLMIQSSSAVFKGISIIANNLGLQGGAIYIIESTVFLYGETSIRNNTALYNAGGLCLYKSKLSCEENSTLIIHGNKAGTYGGGVSALSSSISMKAYFTYYALQQNETSIKFNVVKNQAKQGGGISLWNSNLFILGNDLSNFGGKNVTLINFKENFAIQYGGAVYVDDFNDMYMCSSEKTEFLIMNYCFLQIASESFDITVQHSDHAYIVFDKNNATMAGSTLFGGLFDRCLIPDISSNNNLSMTGTSFLRLVSNIDSFDSISSYPVKVCFCKEHKPDCSYEHSPIYVMKGHTFTLPVVAVDQVNHTVKFSTIASYLKSNKGGLGVDQHVQNTEEACTDLMYNVFSPSTSTELIVLAQGPCGDAFPSVREVKIVFSLCSCPIGFQPTHADETKCECGCDPNLPYIKECNPQQESLIREGNFWIAYVNNTDNSSSGYIGYQHCPLDYCLPATSKVNISLSIPNGSDMQCAFNRSGLLCGGCKPHYSISLGSSHCIQCSSNQLKWLISLIILAGLVGGIILVAIILFLNMTVARGTLNGILIYANIAFTNKTSFLPFTKPNFISVIISWLNLEIGLDTCFYNGMDMYWRMWIQLAFSTYLFFLLAMIIIISERSTILSNIIRQKNPVATLATLVLLSYTKLLHIIISAVSFAIIKYPDGSKKIVWLPDATLEYWSGKHIALFLIAVVLLLVGTLYTALLLFWQWLLPRQDWKILRWVRNQKLCMFIETYHAPYNFKHRYWTGLLLLVRIVLSVVAAVNVSGDPAINLVANCVLIVTLIVFKLYMQGTKPVYKTWLIDILESACLINVLTFSFFKLYYLAENSSQVIIAYLSGIIIIVMFTSVLFYHICTELLFKTKIWTVIIQTRMRRNRDEREMVNLLDHKSSATDEEDEALEPTVTIIERPTPQQPLSELIQETKSE